MAVTQNRPRIPSEQTYPKQDDFNGHNQPWVNTNVKQIAK